MVTCAKNLWVLDRGDLKLRDHDSSPCQLTNVQHGAVTISGTELTRHRLAGHCRPSSDVISTEAYPINPYLSDYVQ